MRGHVTVRVAGEPGYAGPLQAGHPAGPVGGEGMHVGTDADAWDDHEPRVPAASSASAYTRSTGRVILRAASAPGTVCTRTPIFSTNPAPTDSGRVRPPPTTTAPGPHNSRTTATSAGGAATTTTPTDGAAPTRSSAWRSSGCPASRRSAFGVPAPSRTPRPAATTRTA